MTRAEQDLLEIYRKRAKHYDWTANLYYLIGYREWAYRKRAVEALDLSRGDTVVEMCCGTGLNFALLERRVGHEGRIIGVDVNDAMLAQAEERVAKERWRNIQLVEEDATAYEFPQGVDGVLTTFAITLVPEYDEVIKKAASAFRSHGRMVILDFKKPSWAPRWLTKLMVAITAPFGVTLEMADRHPWESLERCFPRTWKSELYRGFSYIAVGEAGLPAGSAESL